MSSVNNTGIVILAAGSSSRLGKPKQLLLFGGHSLLRHSIIEACNSNVGIVVVVTGAHADLVAAEIDDDLVHLIENKNWDEGMASSIRLGVETMRNKLPKTDNVILMVCDQPYVSSSLLNDLITVQQKTGKQIVACNYGDATGPPALFHKSLFKELMQLKGDVGARKIIQQHSEEVATVPFREGKIDIDTAEDYSNLNDQAG